MCGGKLWNLGNNRPLTRSHSENPRVKLKHEIASIAMGDMHVDPVSIIFIDEIVQTRCKWPACEVCCAIKREYMSMCVVKSTIPCALPN